MPGEDEEELNTETQNPPGDSPPPPAEPPPPGNAPAPQRTLGRGGVPMSDEAIAERARRERRKVLVEEYGTDDPAKIEEIKAKRKADLEELNRLKQEQDQKRRSEMSEIERLNEDNKQKDEEIKRLKGRIAELEQDNLATKQDIKLRSIAAAHIKPSHLKWALSDFRDYVTSLSKEEQAKLTDRTIGNWFKKFAEDNPEFAPSKAAPPPAPLEGELPPEPKPPVRPRVLAGRARPQAAPPKAAPPAPPGTSQSGKTVRPNQPNSMNKREVAAELNKLGLKPW